MRLLDNLNNGNLQVPAYITTIESELKKEFAASERKARAEYKRLSATGEIQNPAQASSSKKRKQPGPSSSSAVGTSTTGSPNKKTKIDAAPQAKKATIAGGKPKQGKETKTTSVEPKTTPRTTKVSATAKSEPKPKPKKEISVRTGAPVKSESKMGLATSKAKPVKTEDNAVKTETKLKKEPNTNTGPPKSASKLKKESNDGPVSLKVEAKVKKELVGKAAMPKSETKAKAKKEPISKPATPKRETKVKNDPETPSIGLINGTYDITCDTISSEWDVGPLTLNLALESPSLWGAYDFGMFKGIMFIDQRPYKAFDHSGLSWRGRDTSEGMMSFGDDCSGQIRFLGNGRIEGVMNLYGNCHFDGQRRAGLGAPPGAAARMRQEWEGYNSAAYEYENMNRWR